LDLSAGLIGCRFAHFAAAMLLFGCCAFIALVAPPDLRESLARRFRPLTHAAIVLALVTALLWFLLELGPASGEGATFDAGAIADLFGTRFGEVWIVRIALAAALVGLALARRGADSRSLLLASGLFLATLALVGHASMLNGLAGAAQEANQALHLVCAAFWLGGLVPLFVILRDLRKTPSGPGALIALRRYSLAGHFAVAAVIVTGIVNTRLALHAWPLDLASPYQLLLGLKIAVVAIMALLALFNRYRIVPLLASAPDLALGRLSANVVAELALGAAALALVSAFATFDPT
jgi:putative copper resistance protein D